MPRSGFRKAIDKAIFESEWGSRVAGLIAAILLRALGATWRVSSEGPNPFTTGPGPHLGAMWHRNLLIGCFLFRDKGFSAPVSRSRDGELITQLLQNLGYRGLPRGSSSQGGASALRALARMVESGITVSIQTDGPRGPARTSKIGMVSLARLTGRPISPLAFSARPCIQFRSWDGLLLPLPFARVVCSYGSPIDVHRNLDVEGEELIRAELDLELNRLTDEVDARLGLADPNRPVTRG